MTRTEEFEELRPLLFSIAYRILGSVSEAEDAVQETWLRYEASPTRPDVGQGLPLGRGDPDLDRRAALGPRPAGGVRRAVVPRAAADRPVRGPGAVGGAGRLGVDGGAAAAGAAQPRSSGRCSCCGRCSGSASPRSPSAVGRSEAACRQLAVRARRHMDAGRPRFEADRREREELAERFFDAFREGDVDGLRELLAADVQMVGDGGGKAPQWAKGIIGAENVARVLAAIVPPFARIGGVVEPHEVNGQPGAIFRDRDGKVAQHLGARHPRRADPDDPRGDQPRQARAPGSGGGRLGGPPRGEPGSPAHGLIRRADRAPDPGTRGGTTNDLLPAIFCPHVTGGRLFDTPLQGASNERALHTPEGRAGHRGEQGDRPRGRRAACRAGDDGPARRQRRAAWRRGGRGAASGRRRRVRGHPGRHRPGHRPGGREADRAPLRPPRRADQQRRHHRLRAGLARTSRTIKSPAPST